MTRVYAKTVDSKWAGLFPADKRTGTLTELKTCMTGSSVALSA